MDAEEQLKGALNMQPTNFKNVVLQHYARYPQMEMGDLIKLAFQAEYAGGHFIKDEKAALKRLEEEYQSLQGGREGPLFEDIGNGLCRLHLAPLVFSKMDLETVNRFFVNTAQARRGTEAGFTAKLEILMQCCQEGLLPYSANKLALYLQEYERQGYPPLSHSDIYRSTYYPAYRVVEAQYRDYSPVFAKIDSLRRAQDKVVVAIDGNSGAGKSSLANLLQAVYDCTVFQMDHFFLRPEQRTPARLKEIGGNVDYERFEEEVLMKLKKGVAFQYRVFNCQDQSFTFSKMLEPKKLIIVEGSYSMHPSLIASYDLKVFLEIDAIRQSARILARNGPKMHKRFMQEWVPLENEYFTKMGIKNKSDLIINTIDLFN